MSTIEHGFELRGQATPVWTLVKDVWRSRALVRMLSRRDFYLRYRRPSLGVAWALVLPIVQAAMLSVVFVIFLPSVSEPVEEMLVYPIFALSGTLPWSYFSATLTTAARSITVGSSIASKVYFPRAVLPLVTAGSQLYGFIPTLFVLVVIALGFAVAGFVVPITPLLFLLIPAAVLMVALTAAFSFILAALQVYFRDVAYAVSALLQPWFYLSLVFYSMDSIPEPIRPFVMANPAVGMVEFFRVAFVGLQPHSLPSIGLTLAWTVVLTFVAALIYRRFDRVFTDLL